MGNPRGMTHQPTGQPIQRPKSRNPAMTSPIQLYSCASRATALQQAMGLVGFRSSKAHLTPTSSKSNFTPPSWSCSGTFTWQRCHNMACSMLGCFRRRQASFRVETVRATNCTSNQPRGYRFRNHVYRDETQSIKRAMPAWH